MKKLKLLLVIILSSAVIFTVFSLAFTGVAKALYPLEYSAYVEKYSEEYGIDENLLYAVIKTESSFRPDAVSQVGALGLTQIMPETFDWIKFRLGEENCELSLTDPETSVKYGAYLLGYLTEEFSDVNTALAAYHAGIGRVRQWLEDETVSPDGVTLSKIPVPETAHYVKKVNRAINIYNNLY